VQAAVCAPNVSLNDAFGNTTSQSDGGRVYKVAKDIADEYKSAYNLCRSEDAMARDGKVLADALIAKWGKAQLLQSMPELIDDPDPAIQDVIGALLEDVEGILTSRYADLQDDEGMHKLIPGLDSPGIESKLMQLVIAGDILEDVEDVGVENLVVSDPAPTPMA
jgi:hypothetical protein